MKFLLIFSVLFCNCNCNEHCEGNTTCLEELFDFENATMEDAELFNDSLAVTNSANKESTTETTTLSTTKSTTTSTTPAPPTFRNDLNRTNEVCFCDLKVNECDMNCCCDEDCSYFQRNAFTACKDLTAQYDNRYCYAKKFIYKNNTKHKIVEAENRLFCIVKDNLHSEMNYKSKSVISSLKTFNELLRRKKIYQFSLKWVKENKFYPVLYRAESLIWMVKNDKLMTFSIPTNSYSLQCSSAHTVRYLVNYATECSRLGPKNKNECESSRGLDIQFYIKNMNIISSPSKVNKTDLANPKKICQNVTCVNMTSYICTGENFESCTEKTENPKFCSGQCLNIVTDVRYLFLHNGTDGIREIKAFFRLRNVSTNINESVLQRIRVDFQWANTTKRIFERSGNPGYLPGKPVLAGRKINNSTSNNTLNKIEAIELSYDPRDWLSVFGVTKGLCSSGNRTPVLFKENVHYTCSLGLGKDDFEKGKCSQLQNDIFNYLIGKHLPDVTTKNFFVAAYGNSKVEETGDWVQVLIDSFSILSSQVSFKTISNNLVCKNVITDLIIDVAYSQIGSFTNPQAKILGVSFQFGRPKDLTLQCDLFNCKNSSALQYFKISASVHFIDLTEPAVKEFAEPPGLEAKLPHDFFYPFFSKGSNRFCDYFNLFTLLFLCLILH